MIVVVVALIVVVLGMFLFYVIVFSVVMLSGRQDGGSKINQKGRGSKVEQFPGKTKGASGPLASM